MKISVPFFFSLLYLVLPQLILKPIGDKISVIDLLAPVALSFAFVRARVKLPRASLLTLLFVGYMVAVFSLRAAISGDERYRGAWLYILRTISIFAPIFVAYYMPADREIFLRATRVYAWVSLAALMWTLAAYATGSTLYDARQTYDLGMGTGLFHRLGGLPGETGAFAFNALVVCEMALAVLIFNEPRYRWRYTLFLIIVTFLLLSFRYSLARVMLLNFGVFMAAVLCTDLITRTQKLIVLSGIASGILLIFVFFPESEFAQAVQNRLSDGGSSIDSLSSGRIGHWSDAIELMTANPLNLFFGIGNRMSNPMMGHVSENFVIQITLEYGVIGMIIVIAMLSALLWPIIRAASRGDRLAVAFIAIWLATLAHWQINDVISYYQTFPGLLFVTAWLAKICTRVPSKAASTSSVLVAAR